MSVVVTNSLEWVHVRINKTGEVNITATDLTRAQSMYAKVLVLKNVVCHRHKSQPSGDYCIN